MAKNRQFKRPLTQDELDQLEVKGLWKAIALSRRVAEKHQKITLDVIKDIHGLMFVDAIPEIAGRFRTAGEDVMELECAVPPPGIAVTEAMYAFWHEFDRRQSQIKPSNRVSVDNWPEWLDQVFSLATWVQHEITSIHPFCNGNGRMARIMTNVVLIWFNLPPSYLKIESENKDRYLTSLCQIDKFQDYDALKQVIMQGSYESLEKEEKARRNARKK